MHESSAQKMEDPEIDASASGSQRPEESRTGPEGVGQFAVTRRKLPHWAEAGSVYFLTWVTAGRAVLSAPERRIALESIRHWDGVRWTVYAAVVMPDHVHVLAQPRPVPDSGGTACFALESLLHSVKGYSAHEINRIRRAAGPVWQREREDRIIRNEHELWQKWQYIRDNPVKEGLAATAEDYPWFYQRSGLQHEGNGMPVLLKT